MKLIIAGSRTINADPILNGIILMLGLEEEIREVVSGDAQGVDKSGEKWQAQMKRLCGDGGPGLKVFPAEWERYGRSAGPIRNTEMANYADALLLIWDGKSHGSADMKRTMEKLGKPIYEIIFKAT